MGIKGRKLKESPQKVEICQKNLKYTEHKTAQTI